MSLKVVTIARSIGAGGEEVSRLVADGLGFRVVDEEILERAAEKADLPKGAVEEAERTKPLLARILAAFAQAQTIENAEFGGPVLVTPPAPAFEPLIIGEIREAAREGGVVICGHGACYALAGTDGLLRVLVTASGPTRIKRVMESGGLKESDATRVVADSDSQRVEYLRRFYDVKTEQATHYDLVVNTDRMNFNSAASLVLSAATMPWTGPVT